MMLGLSADQGRPLYESIAQIAATERGWREERVADELESLRAYSDSFRV